MPKVKDANAKLELLLANEFPNNEFYILFNTIANAVISLPIMGLIFAVAWSMLCDSDRSTSTACQKWLFLRACNICLFGLFYYFVMLSYNWEECEGIIKETKSLSVRASNYLPSVSAAIALTPQAYVWRVCISLHTLPRYLIAYAYWIWYSKQSYNTSNVFYSARKVFKFFAVFSNLIELAALFGLTVISSRENRPIHEACFVIFMVGSLLCMLFTCILHSIIVQQTSVAKISKRRKLLAFFVNIASFGISLYYFFRHNFYCEDGVYSLFALCEYIVILSNMAFHYTAALDFHNCIYCFQSSNDQMSKIQPLSKSKHN